MSTLSLARVIARRTVPSEMRIATTPEAPTARELLATIGRYIPTDVTTLYVAAAGGMATLSGLTSDDKRNVAIVVAVLAAFAQWVIGHIEAQREAQKGGKPAPNPINTLLAGWYEILAAGVALFIWATAMPGSWWDWGNNVVWLPGLIVGIASIVIGGLATLLNRGK